MDVTFGLKDLAQFAPYSIVLNLDRTFVSAGAGFTVDGLKHSNCPISDVFNYFDTTNFNYDGPIVTGRDYILWQKGMEQLVKGVFYSLPEQDLLIFIGRIIDHDTSGFSLSALLYYREVETKIRGVYGDSVDLHRFCRDLTSSNSFSGDVNIDSTYGVTLSGVQGRVLWCNKRFLDITERPYDEVVGVRPRDVIYGKGSVYVDADYVDVMVSKGKPFYFENIGYSALGKQFWFGATIFPIFNSRGENIGRIHFIRDISERKIRDINVEENESLLQLCLRAAKIGLWSIDVGSLNVTVNREFKELLTLGDKEEISFDKMYRLLRANNHTEQIEAAASGLSGENPFFNINQLRVVLNGEEFFFNVNAYCIKFDTKGKPIRIVGTITDVTEEKNRERSIFTQKEFYETILNELPADIAIFSKDHAYKFVNKVAIKSDEMREWIIDKNDFDYCRLKNTDTTRATERHAHFENAIASGGQVRFVEENTATGEFILRVYYPIKNAEGNVQDIIGYGIDITEQVRAIEAEKQLNEQKSQFIRITSHELRTPLTIIYSNAEMLELICEQNGEDGTHSHLSRILKEVTSMIDILNELMLVSRIEKDGMDVKIVQTDVRAYLSELVQSFMPYKDGRMLELEIEEGIEYWNIDGKLLKYAVSNVLANAFKYSARAKSPKLVISIRNNHLIIEITDFGIGIPAAEMPNIFKTFFRCSNVGNIQGTGVGLMIVKYAVDKHNGMIEMHSKEGVGTTITIAIPS